VAALLGAKRRQDVRFATPAQLVERFGYEPGCLGPIGLREQSDTLVLVDARVEHADGLLVGAGQAEWVLRLQPSKLLATLAGARVAQLSIAPPPE
jgi:prolyl-tRNA editing enzyme YbaK/EbsC (Cys-tRNA(Pro) deacylase)